MPIYPIDLSVIFVWEIALKLFTQEMVSINLLFDSTFIKKFAQFYPDISYGAQLLNDQTFIMKS